MGYKPGTSLGKDNTGRTEPVPITVKGNKYIFLKPFILKAPI